MMTMSLYSVVVWIIACILVLFSRGDLVKIGGGSGGGGGYTRPDTRRMYPPVITFDDITGSLPYKEGQKPLTSIHIGQRKLFINELQFLTQYARPADVVVYAGAAPGNKTGFLSSLFPEITFLLIDPNPFDIFGENPVYLRDIGEFTDDCNNNIYIINDIMTYEIAGALANLSRRVLFISDIRTNVEETEKPTNLDIIWNLSQQYNWVMRMAPAASMLKFRHPFYMDSDKSIRANSRLRGCDVDFDISKKYGIDFVANIENKKMIYMDGVVNIQPWSRGFSTENRLIVTSFAIKDYGNLGEYEDKMFFYNTRERCCMLHFNDNANRKIGFDHCNDCALENHVWKQYIEKYKSTTDVQTYVVKLSKLTHRPLIRMAHGYLFPRS